MNHANTLLSTEIFTGALIRRGGYGHYFEGYGMAALQLIAPPAPQNADTLGSCTPFSGVTALSTAKRCVLREMGGSSLVHLVCRRISLASLLSKGLLESLCFPHDAL
jgi:hypothetical protein